ncbi:MAG: hypothetical protein NXI04_10310 [Planctomycetaceae bacterium]|nr:hypothetical protein [Planctomycetaceae bacterium]
MVPQFLQSLIDGDHLCSEVTCRASRIERCEPKIRTITAMGKSHQHRGPSYRLISGSSETPLGELGVALEGMDEYRVAVSSHGVPAQPCHQLQGMDGPFHDPYDLTVACTVRSTPVYTSMISDPADLMGFPEHDEPRPKFGDEMAAGDHDGWSVHPQAGPIQLPQTGAAAFLIEFGYGKMIFPPLHDGSIDTLNPAVLRLAESCFATTFRQACFFG